MDVLGTKFTIGADPEYFLQDYQGKLISAVGIIKGSKEAPHPVKHGHIHPDNVCVEMNTKPASNRDEFVIATRRLLDEVRDIAFEDGLIVSGRSYGEFDLDQLEHPDAMEAGCEPDFNAYLGGAPNTPPCYKTTLARAAGGHVHIGCDSSIPEQLIHKLIRTLELTVAIPMLCREERKRRTLYGKAGSFRIKPYGVEYRTPSNAWTLSGNRSRWLYDQVERAMNAFASIPLDPTIPEIIEKHDVAAAYRMMQSYGLEAMPNA
jgi:hypothetical protein